MREIRLCFDVVMLSLIEISFAHLQISLSEGFHLPFRDESHIRIVIAQMPIRIGRQKELHHMSQAL